MDNFEISFFEVLEIYGNQNDVVCEFVGKDIKGNPVGVIRRGAGHNGKWILSIGFEKGANKEYIVSYLKHLRDKIIEDVKDQLADKNSELSKFVEAHLI